MSLTASLKHQIVYPLGEELWLVYSAIPRSIASFQLNANNDQGYRYGDLSILQKDTTYLNKPSKTCRAYKDEDIGRNLSGIRTQLANRKCWVVTRGLFNFKRSSYMLDPNF